MIHPPLDGLDCLRLFHALHGSSKKAAAGAEPPGAALSVDVAGLLAQLARSFALLLPVYALGYLGLSFSWVLLALGLLVWCRRSRGLKATRLCRALALLEDNWPIP